MKILYYLLTVALLGTSVCGQTPQSGDLVDHIDSIIANMPGETPQGAYLQPGASSRTAWRQMIQSILTESYTVADSIAGTLGYQVVPFTDTAAAPDKLYYVLERTEESTSRYWGTFIFNPAPYRPRLVIQCPHPLNDLKTGQQGLQAFRHSGAWAYFVSGTHRCNGLTFTSCDGYTTTCSESYEAYRYSDQAHVVLGTFQITTEEMLDAVPDMIVIQPHGYSPDSGDPDIILSNGTRYTPDDDYALQLRDALLAQDPTLTFKVVHIDTDWDKLTALNNCQGRLINNSADPCGTYASESTGRFIHLEQRYTGLRDTEANRQKLANAIVAAFPVANGFASAQSGSWTDPSTWQGGVVPGSTDAVFITAGHTVSIDDTLAIGGSLQFGGTDANLDLNPDSRLTLYGDITLFSETHNAFAGGWSADSAYVRLAGLATQTLSGWSTSGGSSSFRDLIIEKDSGAVVQTAGTGMRLAIQNSLRIISGTLLLQADDDLEARWTTSGNFTDDQKLTVTIHPAGEFVMADGNGTHFVRSGTGSAPIGPMTVEGLAEFVDASSNDISIAGITATAGGQVTLSTGLGDQTYGAKFNPGTITIDSGGVLLSEGTSSLWFDTSKVIVNRGGIYKTSSSTTPFPPTFVNNGRVRYQRDPSSATTDQVVVDMNYWDIEFSFNGNGTQKLWTLTGNRLIADSLETNNSVEVVVSADAARTLTVDSTLRLTSGTLDISDPEVTLSLSDGALISRATGTVSKAPSFAGVIDVRYTSSAAGVTTGPELPTAAGVLRDLTITGNKGVTLGANVTVNGMLHLADSILMTDAYTVTLAPAATLVEDSIWVVQGTVQTTRTVSQAVAETFGGLGLTVTASSAAPGATTIRRVTGVAQTVGDSVGINRYVVATPAVNAGLNATVVFRYADRELDGLTESSLTLYQSDSGTTWVAVSDAVVDTAANTVTATGMNSLGWLTVGPSKSGCCVKMGNLDRTADLLVTMGDLTVLIDHLFISLAPLICSEEGNVDQSSDNLVTMGDLTVLIDHLFISLSPLPNCP